MIFNIAVGDDDDDGNRAGSGDKITREQMQELSDLADDVGADKERFCKYARVDSLSDIEVSNFDGAKTFLESKRPKP